MIRLVHSGPATAAIVLALRAIDVDLESISTTVQVAMNRAVEPTRSLVWLRPERTS